MSLLEARGEEARLRDRENGNRCSCDTTTVAAADVDSSQESGNLTREQRRIRACYAEADNANVFGRNQNEACGKEEEGQEEEEEEVAFRENCYRRLSSRDNVRRLGRTRSSAGESEEDLHQETTSTATTTREDRDNNERCSNGLSEKCQSYGGYKKPGKAAEPRGGVVSLQAAKQLVVASNVEVRIPSENAAEPCEVAHAPEGASETSRTSSMDTSSAFSNASSPGDDDDDDDEEEDEDDEEEEENDHDDGGTVVLRDTASILQELALQRLSGGGGAVAAELTSSSSSSAAKRRHESESGRAERRSFDSEIGREIVRERKMRQELDCARAKSDESSQRLPPCLRARHARATRAALSRSLDEAKFNRMTAGELTLARQPKSSSGQQQQQHCSTPDVGSGSVAANTAAEKVQLRNLGGLDLGDPQCRERIEKYKEERRTFLRDKYRSESFRGISARAEDDGEQALLNRLKQRASRPSLH